VRNLYAPFDVAENGNQLTVRLVRHSQRKRRATDRSHLRSMAPFLDPTRCRFSEPNQAYTRLVLIKIFQPE
jgi:hypothetical protein